MKTALSVWIKKNTLDLVMEVHTAHWLCSFFA